MKLFHNLAGIGAAIASLGLIGLGMAYLDLGYGLHPWLAFPAAILSAGVAGVNFHISSTH